MLTQNDLEFILRQIQVSEAHAAGNALLCAPTPAEPRKCAATDVKPTGLRTVTGEENNINPNFDGATSALPTSRSRGSCRPSGDRPTPRSRPRLPGEHAGADRRLRVAGTTCYTQTDGIVYDSEPRTVSNLIVDQNTSNPAIQDMVAEGFATEVPGTDGRVVIAEHRPR